MRMKLFLTIVLMLTIHFATKAQFQAEWVFAKYFFNGRVVASSCDNVGGIFMMNQPEDSVCGYGLGDLMHLRSDGSLLWEVGLYYESPCLTQTVNSFYYVGNSLYYSIQDTSGWIAKADTLSNELIRVDTGYTFMAMDIDASENVIACVPQWSQVFCLDLSLVLRWSYTLPYSFLTQITAINSSDDGCKTILFDYDDATQIEPRGIGILKLDSNGVFLWDTFINPQVWQADPDLYVDVSMDTANNLYILSRDIGQFGAYISKIDESGNIVANAQYTPSPTFYPVQMELDRVHSLLYVAGRNNQGVFVIKYDLALNVLDTMSFPLAYSVFNVIGINEYGYLFHSYFSDNIGIPELRLEMYNHLGVMVDSYVYWDSTLYSYIAPDQILFDSLGGIFLTCNARDTNSDDVGLAFKFSNPLSVLSLPHSEFGMNIFPVPASDIVNISVQSLSTKNSVQLYDVSGVVVFSSAFSGSKTTLETSCFSSGMYFIEVVNDSGERSTQKLIIQH